MFFLRYQRCKRHKFLLPGGLYDLLTYKDAPDDKEEAHEVICPSHEDYMDHFSSLKELLNASM